MRTGLLIVILALILSTLLVPCIADAGGQATPPGHELKVMTQNLYLGTDLLPILRAPLSSLPAAVANCWLQVQQTDFPSRAKVIADRIAVENPDVIGLQECSLWRTGPYSPAPATHVAYDYLQILMDELAARELPYTVVAVETGYDAEGTGLFPWPMDVRVTDREAILARTDRGMTFMNASGVNFTNYLQVPFAVGTFLDKRGYCSVDIRYHGKDFRFITTHLEPDYWYFNHVQGAEVLSGPADTPMNVVYVGDLNSQPVTVGGYDAYAQAMAAGFTDSWSVLHPDDTGYTLGHDGNLLDTSPNFTERIDYVLYRGDKIVPTAAHLFGLDPTERTPTGLWPSDHAGLIVTLTVK